MSADLQTSLMSINHFIQVKAPLEMLAIAPTVTHAADLLDEEQPSPAFVAQDSSHGQESDRRKAGANVD
jgi:hypothetical protein